MIETSVGICKLAIVQPIFPSFKYFFIALFFEHSFVRFQQKRDGVKIGFFGGKNGRFGFGP